MKKILRKLLSKRTRKGLYFNFLRFKARMIGKNKKKILSDKIHFGCGKRKINGWLNVDVIDSDYNIDLACGKLPFPSKSMSCAVSQQVIEHLELNEELIPLLLELNRTLLDGGEIWLSCPDLEKVCNYYLEDKGAGLLKDRQTRGVPTLLLNGVPSCHMINILFHQGGEHKNLFDYDLLKWALERTRFSAVEKVDEKKFLTRFPEFPPRNDDYHALYVKAQKVIAARE